MQHQQMMMAQQAALLQQQQLALAQQQQWGMQQGMTQQQQDLYGYGSTAGLPGLPDATLQMMGAQSAALANPYAQMGAGAGLAGLGMGQGIGLSVFCLQRIILSVCMQAVSCAGTYADMRLRLGACHVSRVSCYPVLDQDACVSPWSSACTW
jgi:hypothetical protein